MNRYQFEDLITDYLENKLTLSKRKEMDKYLKENPKASIKNKSNKRKYLPFKISSKNNGKCRL